MAEIMLKFTLCNGVNSGRHFFQHLECWECSKTDLSISWQAFFWKRESPLFMMFCQTGNLCQWRLQIWIAWVLVWDFRCRCFFGDWMTEVGKRIWVLRSLPLDQLHCFLLVQKGFSNPWEANNSPIRYPNEFSVLFGVLDWGFVSRQLRQVHTLCCWHT